MPLDIVSKTPNSTSAPSKTHGGTNPSAAQSTLSTQHSGPTYHRTRKTGFGSHNVDQDLIDFIEMNVARCIFCVNDKSRPSFHRDETGSLIGDCARRHVYLITKKRTEGLLEPIRQLRDAIEAYNIKRPQCLICSGLQVSIKGHLFHLLCPVQIGSTMIVALTISPSRVIKALILENDTLRESHVSFDTYANKFYYSKLIPPPYS